MSNIKRYRYGKGKHKEKNTFLSQWKETGVKTVNRI